jgi:hypothetical protein
LPRKQLRDFQVRRVHFGQRHAGPADQHLARPGWNDTARQAFEQLDAEHVFEVADES